MDDRQFRQLLDQFGLAWQGYRRVRKGAKKRITRHMQALGCHTTETYLFLLEQHPWLKAQCAQLLTISISRFFRDRHLWQVLENRILPVMITQHRQHFTVWSAGCACGEEPYSFVILWDLLQRRFGPLPALTVWATDLNPVVLKRAQAGVYPSSSLKELPERLRTTYFTQIAGDSYIIAEMLKESIVWKKHNLLSDEPPAREFPLIFLRNNLLTYYTEELQVPALYKILSCLIPGGFLVIGTHETLPADFSNKLTPYAFSPQIFQKVEGIENQ
jgi:chemotaxis methyl-accepting protein methylase